MQKSVHIRPTVSVNWLGYRTVQLPRRRECSLPRLSVANTSRSRVQDHLAYSSGRYTGEEGDSGRKIWQVSSDKPVARRRNVQYTSICIAHRRKIALMRSDMDHSFTCKLHHTCLYSPAAEHHRLLAGTHFTVPRKVEGWVDLAI